MKKIGIISDTHAYWDDRYLKYFEPCDEIWHAGDIGSLEVAERLAAYRPLRRLRQLRRGRPAAHVQRDAAV